MQQQNRSAELSALQIAVLTAPVVLAAFINGWYLPALAELGLHWFWAVDMLQWIFLPLGLVVLLARRGVAPALYGFARPQDDWPWLILSTALVALTLAAVYFGVKPWALKVFGPAPAGFQFENVELTGLAGRVLWLYASFTAGFVESIFYIGLPWLACQRWTSASRWLTPPVFSLLSSVVFASVHWEQGWSGMVAAFAFGLAACLWLFRLRSLWPIAVAHTLIDLYSFY
ncbi:MAG: CPBP family intramembrane glutamic endopeptidase [Pedobacter sp.]|nr:CPBP family intramembrane glutamic endopeptidase [Pedobacter sp.]